MVNLLTETLDALKENGKAGLDVLWVGIKGTNYAVTWAEFAYHADFTYDNGHGGQEVPEGLVVVGRGWWLERREYDGSEWWVFVKSPRAPRNPRRFSLEPVQGSYGRVRIKFEEIG